MKDTSDWKKQFFDLEQKYKEEDASNDKTQKLLCRIIIRLTLATKGLDPVLDPHLEKLRDALKKGINENAQRHMSAISEALMRAHDGEVEKTIPDRTDQHDLLQRLFNYSRVTGRKGRRLKELGGQIASAPEAATDRDLDEYICLLTDHPQSDKSDGGDSPGLLGRIFGRKEHRGESPKSGDGPMRLLLSLLAELDWPRKLSKVIDSLEERLEQRNKDAEVAVAKDLTKVVSVLLADLNKETRATGSFLADLMARLHELDEFVVSGHAIQQESLQSGKDLDWAVKEKVGSIATSVRDAQDLQILKQDVSSSLEHIKEHMNRHLQETEERFQKSLQNEQNLRKRLKEVEDETGVLHYKILKAQVRSSLDSVTGLPNRAAYDERLKDEYARWQRFKAPLVLMVWDLDDFKQVNDRFGHQAGDRALRVIGQVLKKRLRQTDFVGRYGGEEFCILLPGTPMDKATVVAEQIRKSVEVSGFHSGQKPITLTISCGFSDFRDGDTPETVFGRADRAMYQAKSKGKNCCVSA